jgi:hypothetical protein
MFDKLSEDKSNNKKICIIDRNNKIIKYYKIGYYNCINKINNLLLWLKINNKNSIAY